eukprot:scaffold25125_cov12-Tisochrysis_lutea.AAC.1
MLSKECGQTPQCSSIACCQPRPSLATAFPCKGDDCGINAMRGCVGVAQAAASPAASHAPG